jgi:hypothetical protein
MIRTKKRNKMNTKRKLRDTGLHIGWATENITPVGAASLFGQYYERMSEYVESPLFVTACAVESVDENGLKEQAIMVSMDLAWTTKELQDSLKNMVKGLIPDFDIGKLFLNATHTHSAPNPDVGTDFGKWLLEKLEKVVVSAWNNRKPAGISSALGYAVVGHNRRVQFADGTTEMYGATDRPDFMGLEGSSDPGVGMVFCWDINEKLTGIIMNVTCPSQVTEAKYYVSADYWGKVRKQLKERFSKEVYVLAQCGAAGDQSPRDLPEGYKVGEPDMWDIPGIVEIGKRLSQTVDNAYPDAKKNIQKEVVFNHIVKEIDLPVRRVSKEEYDKAFAIVNEIRSREPKDINSDSSAWNRFFKEIKENEKIKNHGPWDNKESDFGILRINEVLLENFAKQNSVPFYKPEIHVIRLGDVAIVSNPFELYVEYGHRLKARSTAKQTFIVQLCCDYGGYLPTVKATKGGGYGGLVSEVGPEGGKMLVDESIKLISDLF